MKTYTDEAGVKIEKNQSFRLKQSSALNNYYVPDQGSDSKTGLKKIVNNNASRAAADELIN
jgi:hypothetical protein